MVYSPINGDWHLSGSDLSINYLLWASKAEISGCRSTS